MNYLKYRIKSSQTTSGDYFLKTPNIKGILNPENVFLYGGGECQISFRCTRLILKQLWRWTYSETVRSKLPDSTSAFNLKALLMSSFNFWSLLFLFKLDIVTAHIKLQIYNPGLRFTKLQSHSPSSSAVLHAAGAASTTFTGMIVIS